MALTKLQSQSIDTNITVAGVVTATSFYGDGSNLTGIGSASNATYAESAGISTYATTAGVATYSSSSGIATYSDTAGIATYATSSGIATYSDTAGIATYATVAGLATYSDAAGIATYSSSSGIATYSDTAGVSTNVSGGTASVTSLSVTGISTLGTLEISSGIVTATSGIITYYGDGSKLSNVISGIGIGTTGGVVGYGITFIDLKGAGVSTTFYDSNVGIATIFFEGGGGGSGSIGIGTEFPVSSSSGDLFFHIDYGRTFVYYDEVALGVGLTAFWVDAAPFNQPGLLSPAKSETSFTATAGQTTFSVAYTVGYIDVYLNGVRLSPSEFTATDGSSVVLDVGASLNDVIDIVEYTMGKGADGDDKWVSTVAGIHTLSNVGIGTIDPTSALTVSGDGNFTGVVTATSFSGSGANLTNLNIPASFNELDSMLFG